MWRDWGREAQSFAPSLIINTGRAFILILNPIVDAFSMKKGPQSMLLRPLVCRNALPDLGQRKGERPLQIGQGIVEGPDGAVAARADLERRRLVEEVVDGELDADIAQIGI